MDHIKKSDIPVKTPAGAEEREVFGASAYIHEEEATMKYCRFSSEIGEAPTLHGKTLAIYVCACENARLDYGIDQNGMNESLSFSSDDALYITSEAWARFEFDGAGYVDCVMFEPSSLDRGSAKPVYRITREAAPVLMKNGRKTYRLMGAGGALVKTDVMSGAFATFASRFGRMESHCHENEYMYVIDARDAYVSFGSEPGDMTRKQTLHKGDILRPHKGEWHRFDFTDAEGFVDFCNLFAVPVTHVTTENDV